MLNPGDRIGDWIIDSTLGEGGMGAVFRAHNTLSEKLQAAVKVLKPHGMGDAQARFVREVELLAAVQHPAVVRVLGCGMDEERNLLFMAMELLDGEELTDRLARGPLTFDEAGRYFKQLSEGLAAAHKIGVVHRDIKPQNILITTKGEAKLLDFGIAVQTGGTKLTKAGLMPGTIAYMPPEVFEGQRPDHRADIYALGLVLFESLTGTEAYPDDGGLTPDQNTVKTMGSKLAAESFDPGDAFPDQIRELVKAATDPEPDTRLNDLDAFVKIMQTGGTANIAIGDIAPQQSKPSDTFGLDFDELPVPTGGLKTMEVQAPPQAGGAGKWIAIIVVLLGIILVGGAVVLVGGGVLAGGAAGAAVWSISGPSPPPPPVQAAQPKTTPVASKNNKPAKTGPAKKGWIKGTANGLPTGFPFSIPASANVTNALSSMSDGVRSSVVMYDTTMSTDALMDHYRKEAKAQGMQVYESKSKNGAQLSGVGKKSVLGCSIEEHREDTSVTLSYTPDRG